MFPVEKQVSDPAAAIVSSPIAKSQGSSQVSTTSQQPSPIKKSMDTRRGNYRPQAGPVPHAHGPYVRPPIVPPHQPVAGFAPPPVGPPQYHYYSPTYTYPPHQYFALVDQIVRQIDFYFSDDNLARDFFLRTKMDSNGWVPIRLIASFPMVRRITWEIPMIVEALRYSTNVTVQGDKVRKTNDWHKWIPKA